MFTGIIQTFGKIKSCNQNQENLELWIEADFTDQLKIDQSVAHNGICLTVVEIKGTDYKVVAIKETIEKTTIGEWKVGDLVNLELGMLLTDRLDGHIVQGHVDQVAICKEISNAEGSYYFTFEYDPAIGNITIEKGSITIDGTSLTVVQSEKDHFSVAIIPYTMEHTLFHTYQVGTKVNLEFDVIGKYVKRLNQLRS